LATNFIFAPQNFIRRANHVAPHRAPAQPPYNSFGSVSQRGIDKSVKKNVRYRSKSNPCDKGEFWD